MEGKNVLKISKGNLQIMITEIGGVKLKTPEVVAKSILMLIDSLDVKDFEENGIRNKFEDYMEQFLKEIHAACEWAGWKNQK